MTVNIDTMNRTKSVKDVLRESRALEKEVRAYTRQENRKGKNLISVKELAKRLNVPTTKLKQLRSIENYQPQLIEDIAEKKISVSAAYKKVQTQFINKSNEKPKVTPEPLKPIVPEATGMRVLSMGDLPMTKIISSKFGTNVIRPEGPNANKVAAMEQVIRNNQYRPAYYEPPVVVKNEDGTYTLVAGGHRHIAHENTGKDFFYAAVVEFSDVNGKSANYWKITYQSNENSMKGNVVAKNYRTDNGVMSSVQSLINSGDVEPTAKGIMSALEDQGFSSTTERGINLLNKIRLELGQVDGVTRIYSKAELSRVVETETTPSTTVLVRTMKNPKGFDMDYDSRLIKNIMDVYARTKKNINVFLHWTGLNPSDVVKAREIKDSVLENQYLKAKEFVEAYEAGRLRNRVRISYLPQLSGEYSVETSVET